MLNDGASFTGTTTTEKFRLCEVLSDPPESLRKTEYVAFPLAFAVGVNVKVPLGARKG